MKKKSFLHIGKKIIFSLLIACFFVGGISPLLSVVSDNALSIESYSYAEDLEKEKSTTDTAKEVLETGHIDQEAKKKLADFASLIISIFTPVIAIIVKLIESLMGDSYIMGTNGGEAGTPIGQVLYELWIIFRDVMNYIFILILLGFAFMNVIAPLSDNDSYDLKTILPKMIMAIVVINLTWFGARVVFDAVDVSARVVFALPQSILKDTPMGDSLDPKKNKCDVSIEDNQKYATIKGLCFPAYVNLNSRGTGQCEQKKIDKKSYMSESCSSFRFKKEADGCTEKDGLFSPECFPKKQYNEGEGKEALKKLIESIEKKKTDAKCSTKTDAKTDIDSKCKSLQKKIDHITNLQEGKLKDEVFRDAIDYGPITVYWSDFNYSRFNEGTIAPLFAFSIMQIQNLPRIAQNDISSLRSDGGGWSSLVINVVVSLVIMVILLVLFALMAINLFFRVIVLWINIMFSPFYGLLIFQEQLSLSDSSSEYIGLTAFLKYAFAPVIMGLPLVVGFIMITVGKQHQVVSSGGNLGIDVSMIDNVSNLHQLFYYILAIAVLWVGGVKAIEATSTEFVNNNFIQPISSGVESVAKYVAKAPMYFNFIPVAEDMNGDGIANDSLSLKNLSNIAGGLGSARDTAERREISGLNRGNTQVNYQNSTHYNTYKALQKDDSNGQILKDLKTALESGNSANVTKWETANPNYKNLIDRTNYEGMYHQILKDTNGGAVTSANLANVKSAVGATTPNSENPETPPVKDPKSRKLSEISYDTSKIRSTKKEKIDVVVKFAHDVADKAKADYPASEAKQKEYIEHMFTELQKKITGSDETVVKDMVDKLKVLDVKKLKKITKTSSEVV